MRGFSGENRDRFGELPLEPKRFEVVVHMDQILLGAETIGGVSPVTVGKEPQPPRFDETGKLLFDGFEMAVRIAVGVFTPNLRVFGSLRRIGAEGSGDIDKIERMEVVIVDNMVLNEQREGHEVTNQLGVMGDFDTVRILYRTDLSTVMDVRTHAANPLSDKSRISGIAPF